MIKLGLLPFIERVIVTLGTLNARPKKNPNLL